MADDQPGLAEAIASVRSELKRAQDLGRDEDVRFAVGPVEVEFAVEVTKQAGGQAAVKVLGVLSLGAKGEISKAATHRVKISLNPVGVGGAPFEIASGQVRRPDAAKE